MAVACKREVVLRNLMKDEELEEAENTAAWDKETARNKEFEKFSVPASINELEGAKISHNKPSAELK